MSNKLRSEQKSFLRRNLLAILGILTIIPIPLQWYFGNTHVIYPNNSIIIASTGIFCGIIFAAIFSYLINAINPVILYSKTITIIIFSFCGFISGALTGMALADAALQHKYFSGPNLVRQIEEFAIKRAYETSGKRPCSHVQLRDYFGDFCIDPEEFRTYFAKDRDIRSETYCLRIETERNGTAVRVLGADKVLRPGAVVRCAS